MQSVERRSLKRRGVAGNTKGGVETPTCQSQDRCVEKKDRDRAALEPAVWAEDRERAEAIGVRDRRLRDAHVWRQAHSEYAPLPVLASGPVQTSPAQPHIRRG